MYGSPRRPALADGARRARADQWYTGRRAPADFGGPDITSHGCRLTVMRRSDGGALS